MRTHHPWHGITIRKYEARIYVWVTASLFAIMAALLLLLYTNAKSGILATENDANKKVLYQVKYNIEFFDDMIRKQCQQTFFYDEAAQYIMFNNDHEMVQAMMRLRKLQRSIEANVFLDSIQLYNKRQGIYYSTNSGVYETDATIDAILARHDGVLPKLRPIPRSIKQGDMTKPVFSYFVYDEMGDGGRLDDTLIFNVNSSWIFDNIQAINMVETGGNDRILILTREGEFVEHQMKSESEEFQNSLRSLYYTQPSRDSLGTDDFFTGDIDGKQYFISYVNIENAGWTLFMVKPYEDVYLHAAAFRYSIAIIAAVAFLLAAAVSLSVSRHLYKPIGRLVQAAADKSAGDRQTGDELRFLSETYLEFQKRLAQSEQQYDKSVGIIRQHFIRKLLFDSHAVTREEYARMTENGFLTISLQGTVVLGLLQIDNRRAFLQDNGGRDRELLLFAAANVFSEVLSSSFPNETLTVDNDQIILLLNSAEPEHETYRLFRLYCEQAQSFLQEQLNLSVSAFIGRPVTHWRDISGAYPELIELSGYRRLFPVGCIITPDIVRDNTMNKVFVFSRTLEKDFAEAVRTGHPEKLEGCLADMLTQIQMMNGSSIQLGLTQLLGVIRSTVSGMNQMRLRPVELDLDGLFENVFKAENIGELERNMRLLMERLIGDGKDQDTGKNAIVSDAAKEIIAAGFSDSALCLSRLADMLKLSSSHLSKIFKENTGMSVHEYINSVRLENALHLMETTSLSILQIIPKVGFENESYFYRLFKRRYGVTPKEYMLKKAISTEKQQ